ncbi:MAG: ABC transporter permease, partial [Actinomycetota bacterium]
MGNLGLVGAIVLVALVGAVTAPDNFLTSDNLLTILRQAAVIGVVTVGMTFVIIGGGIDLSVGALVALASVWATTGATQEFGVLGMVGVALLVGTLAGLVNGVLIAYGRVVSFIATLAMLVSARGLAANISNKRVQLVEVQGFTEISQGDFLGLPNLVWVVAIVFVVGCAVVRWPLVGQDHPALVQQVVECDNALDAAGFAEIDDEQTSVCGVENVADPRYWML